MASLVCFDYLVSRLHFAFSLIRGALELNRKDCVTNWGGGGIYLGTTKG